MFFSLALLASASALFVLISASGLLFLGRGKNPKDRAQNQEVSSDRPLESVPATSETKQENWKRTKDYSYSNRLIPQDHLEKSRRELKTVLLEKELVSGALTRLFEAEAAGEISKDEREILGQKYREELKTLNFRINQMDALIEVGDLETLRDQLLQLVREKIDAIERRIERTQRIAEPLIKEMLKGREGTHGSVAIETEAQIKEKPQVPNISDLIQPSPKSEAKEAVTQLQTKTDDIPMENPNDNVSEDHPGKIETPQTAQRKKKENSDEQVEELQKELLEALDRLEKMDLEA